MKVKNGNGPIKLAKVLTDIENPEKQIAITTWKDADDLDLIHHAILSRNHAVLDIILKLFPKNHAPSITPYAHLAAFMGATACLKSVIHHRPEDFFKARKEEHMFKLPKEIRAQITQQTIRRRNANSQKLIDKMRSITSQEDDRGHITFSHITDREINDVLEEIEQLDKNASQERKHRGFFEQKSGSYIKSSLPNIALQRKASKSKIQDSKKRHSHHLPSIHSSQTSSERKSDASDKGRSSAQWPIAKVNRVGRFHLPISKRIDRQSIMVEDEKSNEFVNKTPLVIAAERGDFETIQLLMRQVVMKKCRVVDFKAPLTLCAKTNNPEAIAVLLDHKYSMEDLQFAMITAIRDLRPECLTILMSVPEKSRKKILDGTNLFHLLYTQSVQNFQKRMSRADTGEVDNYTYHMLPAMTTVMILNKENVNDNTIPGTFPLYTLITCAFKISSRDIFFFQQCLELLLEANANPHFAEQDLALKQKKNTQNVQKSWAREKYNSAFKCVFSSVCATLLQEQSENIDMTKLFMKSFILRLTRKDKTPRQIRQNLLFEYMDNICVYGLDATILRCLLRYGADPNHKLDGKYVLNVYFDRLIQHLKNYEVPNCRVVYIKELETLMRLCDAMEQRCLREAVRLFLDDHLMTTPVQALPITRYFCYLVDQQTRSPRSLRDISGQFIWTSLCRRNDQVVRQLKVNHRLQGFILP